MLELNMRAIKQAPFSDETGRIADALIIKSIGHPTRLRILVKLDMRECNVKNIWQCLVMEQAIVSQHLAILKKRGIINSNRCGVEMFYKIVNPLVQKIVAALTQK
jgi:DNA-binding transcriptional ArsR family regulator